MFSMRAACYTISILVLLSCAAFLDRNIISLLADPIARELSISDSKIGILYGLGFGVLYAGIAVPIGRFVDRGTRIWIVAGGVTLWCACTVASAFASSFVELLWLRSGVAIGEAVLAPATISLIADMFPRDKRILPTALYTAVPVIMGSGSYFLGAAALDAVGLGLWGLAPWRLTLVIVGMPGLILAALMLATVREPPRVLSSSDIFDLQPTWRETTKYIWRERSLYGRLYAGIAGASLLLFGATSWFPTLISRGYGYEIADAGYLVGLLGTGAGIVGSVFWTICIRILDTKGHSDEIGTLFGLSIGIITIGVVTAGIAKSLSLAMVGICCVAFGSSAISVIAAMLIQFVAPGRLRGLLIAMNLLPGNLIGLAFGPWLVAAVAERVFDGPFALGRSAALLAAAVGPPTLIGVITMRRGYREAARRQVAGAAILAPQG